MSATTRGPGGAAPSGRLLTLPNALTVARLALVALLAVMVLDTEPDDATRRLAATAVLVLAAVTDLLDGAIARRTATVTRFGIVADPIADKALLAVALVGAALLDALAWWVVVVVLLREAVVTAARLAVLQRGLLPATRGGKTKMLLQVVTAALAMLWVPAALVPAKAALVSGLTLVMVAVTVVTGVVIVRHAVALAAAEER